MKNTKKEFRFFTISDWIAEQNYLSKRHQEGWKFTKTGDMGIIHYFEQCEPEDVIYQIDYQYRDLENKGEYLLMYHDCGWEHVFADRGYHYFRKPVSKMKEANEEIFCDASSRFDMVKRRVRYIVLLILFLLVFDLRRIFESVSYKPTILTFLAAATALFMLIKYIKLLFWYRKSKKESKR